MHTYNKMEFTIVSSHRGETSHEHMQSMKFEFVHPEYLIHMKCESVQEYAHSIVHASTQIDAVEFTRLVRQNGYLKNYGTCVFRHAKSMRTAIIHFTMDIICTESERHKGGVTLVTSKVSHIDWQTNDDIASWCGHVEAKICLGDLPYKEVIRDDLVYIACPCCKVPSMSNEIRNRLQTLKCKFGVNVAYNSTTQRSLLIIKSVLQFHTLDRIKHSGLWYILGCGTNMETLNFLESSPDVLQWLGTSTEQLKTDFYKTISTYHTAAQTQEILAVIFPTCLSLPVGDNMEAVIEFVIHDKVEDVKFHAHKLRSVVVVRFNRIEPV